MSRYVCPNIASLRRSQGFEDYKREEEKQAQRVQMC